MAGSDGRQRRRLEDGGVAERLGTDIRYVNPPYIGPPLPSFDDGSSMNLWGIRRRPMPNEYGEYAEPVGAPYAAWTTVEEAEQFPWPSPDWFDYGAMPALCAQHPDLAIAAGGTHVQDFINGVAFGRGVEQVLLDIAAEDPGVPVHRRAAAPLLPGLHRADPGGRGGADRPGALRRRFRQPAGPADLAGQLRPALRREEEGAFRPGPRLRREGVAPLLRIEPGLDPAVHRMRHGLPCKPSSRRRPA